MSAKYVFLSSLFFILTLYAGAEGPDGIIGEGEYPVQRDFGKMKLYVRPEGPLIAVGIEAETQGWVAAGFGSMQMDGAAIVQGILKKGKKEIHELTASGHRIREAAEILVSEWEISEENGLTVFEFLYPADKIITDNKLEMILAFSRSDVSGMKHSFRTSLVIDLGNS